MLPAIGTSDFYIHSRHSIIPTSHFPQLQGIENKANSLEGSPSTLPPAIAMLQLFASLAAAGRTAIKCNQLQGKWVLPHLVQHGASSEMAVARSFHFEGHSHGIN